MTSIRHAANQSKVLVLLIVVLLVSIGLPLYLDHERGAQERKDLNCVADWANRTAERNDTISALNTAKNAAADDVFRAVSARSPDQFNAALAKYLKASNAYNTALIEHPLPPSPQFLCGGKKSKANAQAVVTATATSTVTATETSAARATRTVTATASSSPRPGAVVTATMTLPGPTRTETFVPAAQTVTRTVTRTATVTARPPGPCLLIVCIQGQ